MSNWYKKIRNTQKRQGKPRRKTPIFPKFTTMKHTTDGPTKTPASILFQAKQPKVEVYRAGNLFIYFIIFNFKKPSPISPFLF